MEYGEIVKLGRHSLMCGDATNINDIKKLIGNEEINFVLTDPPYGNKDIQKNNGAIGGKKLHKISFLEEDEAQRKTMYKAKEYPKILNNDNTDCARKNYEIVKELCRRLFIWGGNYYTDFLPVSRGWIFWDKKNPGCDFADGELAWTNCKKSIRKYEHKWNGLIREGSPRLNPFPRVHPTQKPVELHIKILEDFTCEGETVLDCFGGSGTTLIACEMINRECLCMELSPEYCEVIIQRYRNLAPLFNM